MVVRYAFVYWYVGSTWFQIAQVLRLGMGRGGEEGVDLGIKVNLHTPRCTCDGNVSRDWYGEHVCSLYGEMRCRVLLRVQDGAFCTAVLILFSPRCSCEGNVSRVWYGDTSLHM